MFGELTERYPKLGECAKDIEKAGEILLECFRSGNKLLVCGNGGSCADSDHIVGERMKGFLLKRKISEDMRAKPTIFSDWQIWVLKLRQEAYRKRLMKAERLRRMP